MVRLGWQLGADDGIDGAGQDSTESAKNDCTIGMTETSYAAGYG